MTGWNGGCPAEELLAQAEASILGLASATKESDEAVPLACAIRESKDRYDVAHESGGAGINGIPTGFLDLDAITAGLHPGELVVIGARTSVGKTAFALNITRHVAITLGRPVLFFSLEQQRIELADRLLCCQARVNGHRIRTGTLDKEQQARFLAAADKLTVDTLYIDDQTSQTISRITSQARRHKARHGVDLVVIDYIGLISPEARGRNATREQEVSEMTRRLKGMARELSVPVICLAQLSRKVEERAGGEPKLSDFRDSGAQEQDADVRRCCANQKTSQAC